MVIVATHSSIWKCEVCVKYVCCAGSRCAVEQDLAVDQLFVLVLRVQLLNEQVSP